MTIRPPSVPSGLEVGYAQITSAPSSTSALTAANRVAITGLSVVVTVGTRPIVVTLSAHGVSNSTSGSGVGLAFTEDGTTIGQLGWWISSAANANCPVRAARRLSPAAGSHTYAVQWWAITSGTASMAANDGTGTNLPPASIQVVEV